MTQESQPSDDSQKDLRQTSWPYLTPSEEKEIDRQVERGRLEPPNISSNFNKDDFIKWLISPAPKPEPRCDYCNRLWAECDCDPETQDPLVKQKADW